MRRPPVSVVLIASGSPSDLQACVRSVRAQLGVRDQLLAVTPAAAGDLRAVVTGHRFARDLGAAPDVPAARRLGLAAAEHDIVVTIDGDTLLGPHCIDAVVGAFDDPQVVAAGPRCVRAYGPQSARLDQAQIASPGAFQASARQWRQDHRGRLAAVEALGPVIFAVRRSAVPQATDPCSDPAWRILADAGRIVVVQEALADHIGHDDCVLRPAREDAAAPLLSAALIVKDEEDVLADCLRSLEGLVDEVVVYDTGSTDRTKDIARAHGARVIDGYWDDNFGAARNRCLAHCRGQFVLVIDADEVAQADREQLRELLAATTSDSFHVSIDCLDGVGVGTPESIAVVRVFRRSRCCYAGRLHEQVVDRVLGTAPNPPPVVGLRLRHTGYLADRIATRDKARRNLALAEREADELGSLEPELLLANRARSELLAGLAHKCLGTCQEVLTGSPNPRVRRTTLLTAVHAALALGADTDEVLEWIGKLRDASSDQFRADHVEAKLRLRDGDFQAVLALTDGLTSGTDEDGHGYDAGQLSGLRARALHGLGRHAEAAGTLLDAVAGGTLDLHLSVAADIVSAGGYGIDALVDRMHDHTWKGVAVQAMQCPADTADGALEAMWRRRPGDSVVLAAAASAAPRLPVLRALEWSARLRQHGAAGECPLVRLAQDPSRAVRDRVVAAAVAAETFGDQTAYGALVVVLPQVPDDQADAVLGELRLLAPRLAAAVEPQPAG